MNNPTYGTRGKRRGRVRALLLTAVALATVAVSACEPSQQTDLPVTGEGAQAISDAIDLQVLSYLINNDLPGATVAVTRGSRLVWSKGYGYANRDDQVAMQPWHRSRIGSVSKILTTVGVLQLVEAGKLDLDASLYGDPGPFQDLNTPWPPADLNEWVSPFAVLDDPGMYWAAMRDGVVELYDANHVHAEMNKIRDWASQVTVRHLLSHTSGLLRSGHGDQVDDYYGRRIKDYRDAHLAVLKGVIKEAEDSGSLKCSHPSLYVDDGDPDVSADPVNVPPFGFPPGTSRCYSNHAFGLLGQIISERTDGRPYYGYYDATKQGILDPLGLDGVVPNNTNLDDGLDAWPHGDALDPDNPSRFQSTGGWSATAQDLARVMCGLDQSSNRLRLLSPDMVTEMQSIQFPAVASYQPLGWDKRSGDNERYKNGRTGGGTSVIMKFLPGRFADAPGDEINVAMAINASVSDEALGEVEALLRDIAATVAAADIDENDDLFDPEYRCIGEEPTMTIFSPSDGTSFPLGTEIHFEAEALDTNGDPLPITWSLPNGDTETQPDTAGQHSLFYDSLPAGTHTIVATTVDVGGHQASDEVTVEVTYEAPEVAIVSPVDNATVWAGEALDLVGQSTNGFFSLPNEQVSWHVVRGGELIHTGSGHNLTVPANLMQPGGYAIIFEGDDGVERVSDTISITAEPKPESNPTATIIKPEAGSAPTVSGGLGTAAEVAFAGSAVDSDGDPIDGTHFRWTASRAGEEDILLCAGTNSPGGPGPGDGDGAAITTERNCANFTAELIGHHYAGHTNYTITLKVWDADGNTDTVTTSVKIYVPPEG